MSNGFERHSPDCCCGHPECTAQELKGATMSEPMTDADIDFLLERFDQTAPAMQRQIVAKAFAELGTCQDAITSLRAERDACRVALERLRDRCKVVVASSFAYPFAQSILFELVTLLAPQPSTETRT